MNSFYSPVLSRVAARRGRNLIFLSQKCQYSSSKILHMRDAEKQHVTVVQQQQSYQHCHRTSAAAHVLPQKILESVVKVYVVSSSPNFQQPWQRKHQNNSTGSGFIVGAKNRLIMSNAHVTMDATFIEVRKHGCATRFQAELVYVGHTCDLSLLTVPDDTFWTYTTESLELSQLPHLEDEVKVVGYPTGGDQISITSGVVSRIEQQQYAHAILGPHLLAIQIDAAINPGNSGGPAMIGNKVVGLAFQSLSGAENIGFIIPTIIMEHFLRSYWASQQNENSKNESKRPLRFFGGFCSLGIFCQEAINDGIRDMLKMGPQQTGVLLFDIMPTAVVKGYLNPLDVLLEIDGNVIANDGTVQFRDYERIRFDHFVHIKKVGEPIRFKVLRDGTVCEIDVPTSLGKSLAVDYIEDERGPAYVILGGLVFTELYMGYLLEWGEQWFNHAPRRLSHLAVFGMKQNPDERAVVLTSILLHKINKGYNSPGYAYTDNRITKINDVAIINLKHFASLWKENKRPFVTFELEDKRRLVLNYEEAKKYSKEILEKYGVPSPASPDFLQYVN